eukprot:NODE_7719_length_451_cov_27.845771_g7265_i0.p1 GENE.NODE_7719_length_451_cov_27.845771_g7265_i0~~NODE_7719_length_451_cov_27.845771_g7265_i0.p1  ORF type:complete len:117 (-),score=3.44 NODE_7719_length_451_cov_27.845771_g7265_i0:3-353(-)
MKPPPRAPTSITTHLKRGHPSIPIHRHRHGHTQTDRDTASAVRAANDFHRMCAFMCSAVDACVAILLSFLPLLAFRDRNQREGEEREISIDRGGGGGGGGEATGGEEEGTRSLEKT